MHREAADYFDFVLTAKDLDNYFQSKTLHPSFIRAIKSGVDVDAAKWSRIDKRLNTDFYSVVDTEKLFAQFSSGASLVVNVSEGPIPPLSRPSTSLNQQLNLPFQAN